MVLVFSPTTQTKAAGARLLQPDMGKLPPTLRTKRHRLSSSPRISMFIPIPFPIQVIKTSLSSFVTRTPFHSFLPSQFFTMVERKLSDWSVGGPFPPMSPYDPFPTGSH
ncbi:hypothetical protein CKAH01_12990 [Colletotrichum kahawae]|uniref:Uncharacterized protein n=1 Tax=Colletotrichum kahawae TaxID=34407 RepID=A0AAD9YR08_COLKA|nr:hypothetical protein CKAH01_12990 [Colletotrichum kahawae]